MTVSMAAGAQRVSFWKQFAVGFVIEPSGGGESPRIEQWEGRNAIAMPETRCAPSTIVLWPSRRT